MAILIGSSTGAYILEIGCGTGALFDHLGFNQCARYVGVDVSESMINEFKQNFPDVNVRVADGESYFDDLKYDLIFSNGVIQHFTKDMMELHISNSVKMLNPGGRIVDAMVPWKEARSTYAKGILTGSPNPGLMRSAKGRVAQLRDSFMGRWYSAEELYSYAVKYQLSLNFHGSLHYPYRLHVVYTKSEFKK